MVADMRLATNDEQPRDAAQIDLTAIERVIVAGDLSKLSPDERWSYYRGVCQSVGLNPYTRPFEYLVLNGKTTLYALKGATDQLRRIYGVSIADTRTQIQDGLVIVTVTGTDARGRADSEIGAVVLPPGGEARANALMKALTKAKRRLTLSMCGLGMLDETEVETIPGAARPAFATIPEDEPEEQPAAPACQDCGSEVSGARFRDGVVLSPGQVAEKSAGRFGRVLCLACSRTAAAHQKPAEDGGDA